MKIAVTGATGFLGRHILTSLDGHDVVGLSRHREGQGYATADILDVDSLCAAFAGMHVVVHAAGTVDHHPDAAARMWADHVDGTRNVIAACRAAGVKRLIHISSSGTVAVSDEPVALDEHAPSPLSVIQEWPYYRAKKAAEDLVLASKSNELDVICLNPSLLLGPGDARGSSTAPVRWFLDGQVPVAPSGGLSFADARDVADAVAVAITGGESGQRYLLGAANWSFRLFYERIGRIADKPAPAFTAPRFLRSALKWAPNLGRDGFITGFEANRADIELASHFWYLNDSLARKELGWAPRDPVTTLSDTVTDLRQRGLA